MKDPLLQSTRKWQNRHKETRTYLLARISCCPVQEQNCQCCSLIHYSLLPCGQKTKPMSWDSLPDQSLANFSDAFCAFLFECFWILKPSIHSATIWGPTLCLGKVIEKKHKALIPSTFHNLVFF